MSDTVSITADLHARIAAALRDGHGPDCEEPDEDGPGRCVCEQGALARELEAELEQQGRYLEPGEPEHVDPPTDDLRALDHPVGVAVNPGTGPVEEATLEDACVNVAALVLEVAKRRGVTYSVQVSPEPPRDGRWLFELTLVTERRTVRMPGLPLERVRFTGEAGQDAWDYPRLYVDGSSWLWLYAVRMLENAPEEDDD